MNLLNTPEDSCCHVPLQMRSIRSSKVGELPEDHAGSQRKGRKPSPGVLSLKSQTIPRRPPPSVISNYTCFKDINNYTCLKDKDILEETRGNRITMQVDY